MDAKPTRRTRSARTAAAPLLAAGAAIFAFAGEAQAAERSFTPLAPAGGYTVFTEGDASVSRNENQGSMALGGNLSLLSGGDYNVGNDGTSNSPRVEGNPTALYVGGRVSFSGGSMKVLGGNYARIVENAGATGQWDGGGVTYVRPAGGGTGQIAVNTGQPVSTLFGAPDPAIDFAGAFAQLRSTATGLATCEANVTPYNANGNVISLDAVPYGQVYVNLVSGTNVLNLTTAQLRSIGNLTFRSFPADAALLINVTDWTTGSWTVPNFSGIGDQHGKRILINFPTATELRIDNGDTIKGAVYAPNAAVTHGYSRNIDGNVVAASLVHNGGGEIHDQQFTPTLTCTTPDEPEEPETPEEPEQPEEPENPEQPEEPENPEQPEEPENPEQPENPQTPETPETPEQPENPQTPETPEQPQTPQTPETPEQPQTPQTPEQPQTPQTPEQPQAEVASTPVPLAPPTPAPTPASTTPTPRGGVRGTARAGQRRRPRASASIRGTVGCVKTTARATVRGSQMRTVTFKLNGKVLRTVRVGARRAVRLAVPATNLASGAHTITARVTFSKASAAKPKQLKLSFVRCASGDVKPAYTG